ncbi:MAG: hypothetical protein ACXAEN_25640 [Candidatus Thorarchaeota archaeon]|jgi:hypothetical protein
MGLWSYIAPEGTINEVENPSFEVNVTDGWTFSQTGAGGAVSRVQDGISFWGTAVARLAASVGGISRIQSDAFSLANNATVIAFAYILQGSGIAVNASVIIRDTTNNLNRATGTASQTDEWVYVETASWTNTTGGPVNIALRIDNNDGVGVAIRIDGAQLEEKSTATTYCDGTRPGCEWLGAENNSRSQRSALSRACGVVTDFAD